MTLYIWQELREEEFAQVLEETDRTCVIPIGCIEKHGQHTALGTDNFIAEGIVRRVAQVEPICIFPTLWTGCLAGSYVKRNGHVILSQPFIQRFLEEVVAEIARNGFNKIIFANAHGGNHWILQNFIESQRMYKKDYAVFYKQVYDYDINSLVRDLDAGVEFPTLTDNDKALMREIHDKRIPYGHACIFETSVLMALRPDAVCLDRATAESGASTGKGDYLHAVGLGGVNENFPNAVTGHNPECSNVRLGNVFVEKEVQIFADAIRTLKNDKDLPRRIEEEKQRAPYVYSPR